MEKTVKWKNLSLVFLAVGLDLLFGPLLLCLLKSRGAVIYSPDHASRYLSKIILQTVMLCIYPVCLFCFLRRKQGKQFYKQMGLTAGFPLQRICIGILGLLLAAAAGFALRKTGDPTTVLFSLIYYVFAVGVSEEFLVHGVCPHLLKGFPTQVQYLLPNVLFAMLHVFAYNDFAPLNVHAVLSFLQNPFFSLLASGCCLHLLKRRTGTLWVPILLHGLMDFTLLFL